MRARDEAATALAAILDGNVRDNPHARHILVCHSHGGNVVLHAVSRSGSLSAVDSLVCMGTPFLHVRPNETLDLGGGLWIGLMFAAPIAIAIWMATLGASPAARITLASIALAASGLVVWLGTRKQDREAQHILDSNRWPETFGPRILLLGAASDEAAGVLIAMQFSAWLLRNVSRVLLGTVGCLKREISPIRGCLIVAAWLLFALSMYRNPAEAGVYVALVRSTRDRAIRRRLICLSIWHRGRKSSARQRIL
jgi:hypothetical protein